MFFSNSAVDRKADLIKSGIVQGLQKMTWLFTVEK